MRYGSGFRFGFGFWFREPRYFPRREEYIGMLKDRERELEAGLREVEREIEELKREG